MRPRLPLELATALLLATAVCDALGHPRASFYLLVATVPLAAVAGLVAFARSLDGDAGRLRPALVALLVAAVVVGAALRDPGGHPPLAATAVLALGLVLLAAQGLAALVPVRRERA